MNVNLSEKMSVMVYHNLLQNSPGDILMPECALFRLKDPSLLFFRQRLE